mgnify:CR=1 FL=1
MYIKWCQVFFIKKLYNSLGQESSLLYQCDTIFFYLLIFVGMTFFSSSRVFLFYFTLVSLGILWPSGNGVVGAEYGDTYKHVWSFWHTDQILFQSWPWTNKISTPHGGFLLDVMLAPSILFLPVTWIFGPIVSGQLFVFLSIFFVGWSVFSLSKYMQLNSKNAFVAGILAQSSPYLLGYPLASGVYERLSIWIFPFLWLMFLRYRDEQNLRWMLYGGLSLLFMAFSCQNYAVYAMVMLGLGWFFFRDRSSSIYIIVMTAILLLTFVYVRQITQSSWTLAPQPMRFSLLPTGPLVEEAATLSSLFSPLYTRIQNGIHSGDWLLRLCYVGLLPIAVCVWKRKELPKMVSFMALFFLVLSLGSTIAGFVPNLLYWLLTHLLPVYGSIPDVFQQVAVVMPFLSIAIMFALQKERPHVRYIFVFLIFLERMIALPHHVVWQSAPTDIPSIYEQVQDGAIIDIPRQLHDQQLVSAQPFLYQMKHDQPLAISVYMGVTGWDAYAPIAFGKSTNWSQAFSCMRKGGIRWVMIHTDWFPSMKEGKKVIDQISLSATSNDGKRYLYDLSNLAVAPMEDVYLPPRNTALPDFLPPKEEIPLDVDLFSMVQGKCPIDSAAQHHPKP